MKVIFATPFSDLAGGINQWAKHIVSYYNDHNRGIDLTILPMNDTKNIDHSVESNSLFKRLYHGYRTYTKVVQGLKVLVKKNKYDILHVATSASISLLKDVWMINVAKRNGIKSVIHFHFGRIPDLANKNNWEWKLLSKVVKLADVVVVIDKASYNTLLAKGFNNVALLPNPLSQTVESLVMKYRDLIKEDNKVVFVGHCVAKKGVYELVKACKEIKNVKLSLVGPITDNVKNDLAVLADNEEWLDIKGKQPFDEVIREMSSCSVFVLPTYTEGFPNVIIESMACGCPIVTTPVGAIPEMLNIESDEPCGVCVPVRSIDQLRDGIKTLLNDNTLSEKLSERAKMRVKKEYCMNIVWEKLLNVWKSC